MVLKAQDDVPPDERRLEDRPSGGIRVNLDPNRQCLVTVAGEVHLMEEAGEAEDGGLDHSLGGDLDADPIPLLGEIGRHASNRLRQVERRRQLNAT